jgi:SAM-dependent methyltransferase
MLDFGCGTGYIAGQSVHGPLKLLAGMDIHEPSVRLAVRDFPEGRYLLGNGLALPFRDGSFDAVISHVVLPYMDLRKGFAEIRRVLRPGGYVWLSFHSWAYLRFRFRESWRKRAYRETLFFPYMMANGLLLDAGLPQVGWFNGRVFESVQSIGGTRRELGAAGFEGLELQLGPESDTWFGFAGKVPGGEGEERIRLIPA